MSFLNNVVAFKRDQNYMPVRDLIINLHVTIVRKMFPLFSCRAQSETKYDDMPNCQRLALPVQASRVYDTQIDYTN